MQMLAVGGKFLSITIGNNYMGHGFYQFSPELFFRVLDRDNGFEMERMILFDSTGGAHWYEVSDPKRVGRRVEARTKGPIELFVQARKIADVPAFTSAPQQSDYVVAWDRDAGGAGSASPRRSIAPTGDRGSGRSTGPSGSPSGSSRPSCSTSTDERGTGGPRSNSMAISSGSSDRPDPHRHRPGR